MTKESGRLAHTLLSSPAFARLLAEARTKYDRVVLDTAPVGAVADAITLSKLADGVIWVVRFNKIRIIQNNHFLLIKAFDGFYGYFR